MLQHPYSQTGGLIASPHTPRYARSGLTPRTPPDWVGLTGQQPGPGRTKWTVLYSLDDFVRTLDPRVLGSSPGGRTQNRALDQGF